MRVVSENATIRSVNDLNGQAHVALTLAGYGLANCLRISIGLPQDNDRLLATLPQVLAAGATQVL